MKKRIIIFLAGLLIASASFNLFLSPANIAAGGITGLAIIFNKLYHIDISLFVFCTNIILIIASFYFLGRSTTKKTLVGAILSPIFLKLTSPLNNVIDTQAVEPLVLALFGGITSGIGYGLIFKQGYTSGGTDILNQMISQTYKLPISTSIILVDGLIVIASAFVFGFEKMVYAIITLFLLSIYSNKSMIGIGKNKNFYIYTTNPQAVKDYLINVTKNDITILEATGAYKAQKVKIIFCAVSTSNYYKIKEGIMAIDPSSFIIINESYELINQNRYLKNDCQRKENQYGSSY